MQNKILVTGTIPLEWAGELKDSSEIIIWESEADYLMPREKVMEVIGKFDAIINFAELRVDVDLLSQAHKLRIVSNASIGYDNLDLDVLSRKKIWACNSPGFFNYATAEYIFGGMLILSRKMHEADRFVRRKQWKTFEPGRWDGRSLKYQVLGIIGMGAIGKELASMACCMGMEVIYFDKYENSLPGFTGLKELMAISDFISVNVPLNDSTRDMVDESFFKMMKEGAIFINTSRGGVVDEHALIRRLETQELAGAILDVFRDEPVVPAVLMEMDNVLITPHMAGGTKTSRKFSFRNAFLNIQDVFEGKKPRNALNTIGDDN